MRRFLILVGLLSTLAVAACSGGGSDPPPPPPPPPPTTGSLALANSSGVPVHELYISRSTDTSWGAQRNGTSIPSGTTFTQPGLDPTLWDLRGVYVGTYSDYFTYGMNLNVTAGSTTTVTAYSTGFTGTLDIVNSDYYGRTVNYLYVTPANYSWGNDWLGVNTLPYDYDFEIYDTPTGYYDVWCAFADGYNDYVYDVQVSSLTYTTVYCGF